MVTGRIKVKVGPVALTYSGSARFTERDEQALRVTLEASGKETRGSGTASAKVRSSLQDEGDQTRVTVHTTMTVTGRPAQFGRGVMADIGGRIIEKFATNLAAQLAGGGQAQAVPAAAADGAGEGSAAAAARESNGAAAAGESPGAAAAGESAGAAVSGNGALQLPIEDLQLPLRSFNSLRREGIHTVGDLSARSETDLLAITNLGPQSVKEIKEKLAERGLGLTTGTPGAGPATASSDGERVTAQPLGVAPPPVTAVPDTPPPARPPDEDAIDLLSVAGFPVLKRALPAVGVVALLVMLLLGARRRRRRRTASGA